MKAEVDPCLCSDIDDRKDELRRDLRVEELVGTLGGLGISSRSVFSKDLLDLLSPTRDMDAIPRKI